MRSLGRAAAATAARGSGSSTSARSDGRRGFDLDIGMDFDYADWRDARLAAEEYRPRVRYSANSITNSSSNSSSGHSNSNSSRADTAAQFVFGGGSSSSRTARTDPTTATSSNSTSNNSNSTNVGGFTFVNEFGRSSRTAPADRQMGTISTARANRLGYSERVGDASATGSTSGTSRQQRASSRWTRSQASDAPKAVDNDDVNEDGSSGMQLLSRTAVASGSSSGGSTGSGSSSGAAAAAAAAAASQPPSTKGEHMLHGSLPLSCAGIYAILLSLWYQLLPCRIVNTPTAQQRCILAIIEHQYSQISIVAWQHYCFQTLLHA
jgi:hypothetical protein